MKEKGVSIIICCYNSSKVLTDTLKAISSLEVPGDVPWELIIVDNNSNDGTGETARKILQELNFKNAYKLLHESDPGLSNARKKGFDNSSYEYLIFCDDDNHLEKNYVELCYRIMNENEDIGALGGYSEAVTDGKFPEWFEEHKRNYSVGSQSDIAGDITWATGSLWGAGLVVRRSALKELFDKGYRSYLSDRIKDRLASGGDIELCYALRLAGWKIWYEPELKIRHFISKERLSWKYLRKLSRGFGAQKVDFDAYLKALDGVDDPEISWHLQSVRLIRKIRGYGFRKLIRFKDTSEGDADILRMEKSIGRLTELLKIRGNYTKRIRQIRNAGWRKVFKEVNDKRK